jgi:choline dehydrogenase
MGFADSPDFNDPESTGVGPSARNVREGIRVSTAIAYLAPARNRLNLTIRGGFVAKRVVIEDGRAIGVEIEAGGETQHVYGKRITLSAGAVSSPAILMRSGIGPRSELERHGIGVVVDAPGVGANLIDHPRVPLMADLNKEVVRHSEGIEHSHPSAVLRYTGSGSKELNDMQLWLQTVVDWTMLSGLPVEPSMPPKLLAFPTLQRPRSRGRLTLRSASPGDQPNIELNFLADAEDMRRMLDGMRLAWRILHQPAVAAGWQEPIVGETGQVLDEATVASDSALIDFIRNNCTTLFHPVGTMRMGPAHDPMAVVDQYCCMRGIEGLRVVDASVMPNIVRANTNLTCIMIGERVADWMRSEV